MSHEYLWTKTFQASGGDYIASVERWDGKEISAVLRCSGHDFFTHSELTQLIGLLRDVQAQMQKHYS